MKNYSCGINIVFSFLELNLISSILRRRSGVVLPHSICLRMLSKVSPVSTILVRGLLNSPQILTVFSLEIQLNTAQCSKGWKRWEEGGQYPRRNNNFKVKKIFQEKMDIFQEKKTFFFYNYLKRPLSFI